MFVAGAGLAGLALVLFFRPARLLRWRESYVGRREHYARQLGRRTVDDLPLRERFRAVWLGSAEIGEEAAATAMSKVPAATVSFWVTKVLTTGMGETTSDFLVHRFNPVIPVALGAVFLSGALFLQFAARRYVPWVYWLAVVLVAVFGTMAADFLHVQLGIAYIVSTSFFVVVLVGVFAAWYATEKTLSIHSIVTPRREVFYWATVLTTFALGTAAGDMTALTFHLGYFSSGLLFAALIAVPALGYRFGRINGVLAFWMAYVLTRPLGASFADWIAAPLKRGGLGAGDGVVSLLLLAAIVVCVAFLNRAETFPAR